MNDDLIGVTASAILFFRNPVLWFSRRNWVVRVVLPVLLFPLVGATSIVVYEQRKPVSDYVQMEDIQLLSQELSSLQEKIDTQQMKFEEAIMANESIGTGSAQVLGVATDMSVVIYLPPEIASTSAYESPSLNSRVITNLDGGSLHFVTKEEAEWYEVRYNGEPAWVPSSLVVKLLWP